MNLLQSSFTCWEQRRLFPKSCPGEGITVTGCGCVLQQHLSLASAIHEVSVPSPGWGQGATQELDALSSCFCRRSSVQHILCLVLKATCTRALILLGSAYRTGTGSSELPPGVPCVGEAVGSQPALNWCGASGEACDILALD